MILTLADRREIRQQMSCLHVKCKDVISTWKTYCKRNQRVHGASQSMFALSEISYEMRVVEVVAAIHTIQYAVS